jgi:hypothetical protein
MAMVEKSMRETTIAEILAEAGSATTLCAEEKDETGD